MAKSDGAAGKALSAQARRALEEAEQRRKAAGQRQEVPVRELAGRDGPEPTRFGDWEKNGIISDF